MSFYQNVWKNTTYAWITTRIEESDINRNFYALVNYNIEGKNYTKPSPATSIKYWEMYTGNQKRFPDNLHYNDSS